MFSKAQIRQISNIISNNVDRKHNAVFFEKLKNGVRSIKVWYWGEDNYAGIIADLTAVGFTVKCVPLQRVRCAFGVTENPVRLHVSV